MSHTVVATANVLYKLRAGDAGEALRALLEREPDLVGLQEWNLPRYRLLGATGSVELVPKVSARSRPRRGRRGRGFLWTASLVGGCVVGARADRFERVESSSRMLSGLGRSERPDHWLSLEPPRIATVATFRDHQAERTVCLVSYHLAPGVQAQGRYRDDRPVLVGRHRREVRNLQKLIDEQLALGHVVYAVGDSNYDGLRLDGVTSAWEGRDSEPGTLGPHRKVDDVFGPGPAASVATVTSASDHKAVIVDRVDAEAPSAGSH